jgi:hypothetical protein
MPTRPLLVTVPFACLALSLAGAPVAAQSPLPGRTAPAALAAAFGAAATNQPFAAAPCRFQQVIESQDLPSRLLVRALALRKDELAAANVGRTVELSVRLGYTTRGAATLQSDFAANFDLAAPTPVFVQRWVRLPDMPAAAPVDPTDCFFELPLDAEFDYVRSNGNLLVEVGVFANDFLNLPFPYPLDAGAAATSSTVFATQPSAALGTVQRNTGLALRFVTHRDRRATWARMATGIGPAGRDQIELVGGNPPQLGSVATMDLLAPGWAFAGIVVGLDVRHDQLLPQGGPGGYVLAIYPDFGAVLGVLSLGLQNGFGSAALAIPNATAFRGLDLVLQAVTASPAVPQLLGGSNVLLGNLGDAAFGSAEFAIAHGPFTIPATEFLKDASGRAQVIHQAGAETADKINVQGTKNTGVGPLRIHVSNPPGFYDVPAGQASFSVTLTVAPGGQVTMQNLDQSASLSGLTYEVTVVD